MDKLLTSAQLSILRISMVMHLLRLLVKPKWMEERIIPNVLCLSCMTTRVPTHLWWVYAKCYGRCIAIYYLLKEKKFFEELSWRYTDLMYDCSVQQVESHSSCMIGTRQNSLEDSGTKYLKDYYYSLVFNIEQIFLQSEMRGMD